MDYHEKCKHKPHIKVINKKGDLICAKDGVRLGKPKIMDDDMSMPISMDSDTVYVEPHDVLFSTRKPDGWKRALDKEYKEHGY